MSFTDDFLRERQKLSGSSGSKKKKVNGANNFASDYMTARQELGLGPIPFVSTKAPAPDNTTADDIGPVKRTYFQKGAFEDGWQFGDLIKTILGTSRDVMSDIQVGGYSLVENAIDAGATLLANVPGWEDELSAFVAKDIIDEKKLANFMSATVPGPTQFDAILRLIQGESLKDVLTTDSYEGDSILGDKSDSLAQSGGQLATQFALQSVGVPWWVTSAVSSYGSQAEQAFREGATAGEANVSALISAGAEVLSEKIFGGFKFQGKAFTEGVSDIISRGVSSKLLKSVMKLGLDAGGEAIEEVFSSVASRFGQWLTYQDDKTIGEMLASEEAFDEYLESAIGGGLLGGGNTALSITQNAIAGKNPVSGLSATEEQVIRDIFDSRVAEEAKNGKVSEFRKNAIWDEVVEKMDRGEISIDEIERILGGDTYKAYSETVANEDAIWNEYKALRKIDIDQQTKEQRSREAELRKMTEGLDKSTTRADLAKQLQSEVYDLAKGSRLVESYNERVRRGQKFEADVSKYKESERKIVQDAIDSGILNNSRKVHEFVDWVAKVAGAKGLEFKFTNNEKLRGTQFEVKTEDGKVRLPNGYRDGNTIGINIDSRKERNAVVGHEITHVLEGTELYKALQDAVFRYAVAKDGQAKFDQRLKAVEKTYKGVSEDAKGELTADLVGEYLFTDKDFIKKLTENRNLFQKVYDEIKHMWKLATAGSREKRELERVKKAFEDAFRDSNKKSTDSNKDSNKSESMAEEVQNSLSHDSEYMDDAIAKNDDLGIVESETLEAAKAVRERIAQRMNEIKDKGLVGLPEDIAGNTYIANSSYDGTEENTTICPRSLASEAFVDAVSEYLGRPLTVEEQIYISQDLQGRTLTPECIYCYVATDRKAYRAFLGEYINQRDAVLEKLKADPDADVSRSGELYKNFLNGRKDTKNMYDRFKMWADASRSGKPMIQASHLANINKLMGDINSEFGEELKPQIVDAMKYAQSASWAKKRIGYVAYNGHILKWKQDRINKLNSHYGLRMYSFSDFHPAFVLENMQMITDASVRGLKMLGYTKDTDFVEIFAPTGMNINISTFGFESGGEVFENNLTGAAWDKARELRAKHPNVGITFVATNDTLVNWALDQDWIDVVIPYHLVRTGEAVAKAMKYTNYTQESSDKKGENWKKGDKKYIAPTEHNNDKATYLAALEKNNLRPRFERFLENPNYMKLVNECRQPASQSQPVQPVFNEEAANLALAKLEANGYYQPIGGSVDRMYEIAGEVAEAMTQDIGPVAKPNVQFSLDIEYVDGTVEELANLRDLTDEQAISFLQSAKSGDLIDETYIPVRSDLPQVIIDTLEQVDEYLENRSLVMEVNKARRLMRPDKNRGSNKRGHSLSPRQIGEIIKDIENPVKMFYQTNRIDRDGNPLPNNVAIFVKYSKNGVNGFATVEFENPERTEVIGLEHGETNFYTVNTAFFPDTVKDGKPFNYLEKLRDNPNNIELEIKRKQPGDSTIWKKHPSTINELPSGTILPDIAPEVKKNSLTEDDDIAPVRNADKGSGVKQLSLSEDSDIAPVNDMGIEDLSIDDIMKMSDEEFDEACRKFGIYDYLEMDDDILLEDDSSIEDIAEEMDVEPEVINILFRRSGLGDSHVEDKHKAVMTQDRIDQRIREHGASAPDYARAYITRISPRDFIDMTVYEKNMDRDMFDTRVRGDFDGLQDDWDYGQALREKEEPPMLVIDKSNGKIIGHNGRHRMRALEKAGIESVEIEVEFHDEDGYLVKYDAQTIPDMAISSQFDTAIETHISNIIPLNKAHRGEIWKYYGENAHENASVKYSLSEDSDGNQLSEDQQEFFVDSKARDENGNLAVLYHGSRSPVFTEFDVEEGVWLTPDQRYAEVYADMWHSWRGDDEGPTGLEQSVYADPDYRLYKMYANITNPLDLGEINNEFDRRQMNRLARLLGVPSSRIRSLAYDSYGDQTVGFVYEVTRQKEFIDIAREKGYDGFTATEKGKKTFCAFNAPNQVKLTSNEVPSGFHDIRYSLSDDSDIAPIRHGNYHVTGEDIAIDTPFSLDDIAPVDPKYKRTIVKDSRFIPGAKKNDGILSWAKEHLLDNGMVFEDLAKKAKNRALEAKWNFIRNAPSAAQHLIAEGDKAHGIKSLKSIMDTADKAGKRDSFHDYLLHFHNFDRMSLESRFPGSYNKPVFGDRVTAEESMKQVEALEKANPQFKIWAREVYKINDFLRDRMVEAGIITQETADLWSEMYPHYVPVYRDGENGFSIKDSLALGVNAPVKRATGGNGKTLDVLSAMASRTLQTYKAIAKNNFGVELMNTLGSVVESNTASIDEFTGNFDMDSMFGQNGNVPTYAVYQDGQRVTFEITDEMYEAMKPKKGITQKKIPVLSHINSIFRGLTTQYNPVFALTNPIKDIQEVLLNSQHPGKTYASIPVAIQQMAKNGNYYQEYLANGGKTNTYFDDETKTFKEEPKVKQFLDKVFGFNDYIEMTPRLAEYIASREAGRSIEESVLDAARVTTNFAAGGDVTKFANRNGCTFLNASVQGAIQQVRNVREAHQKGAMGYVGLLTRFAIGGLVPVLLNNLMWDDDEEYEDLADYVKQDYYIIGKYGDGKFIRIPKGRTLAVLQEAMDIVMDTATGDDEVDMARFLALGKLAIDNIAPNDPMDNNIIAPIRQVIENKTWYGEELVPSRLADLPAAEQYDDKTDSISKWLGETFNVSPYKLNYLLNQYSGGIGDFFLPMLTPRAESGDDSLLGTLTAPLRDKFTTDSVLNSQTVSDFYDTCDELERRANSMEATDEDAFKYMYMRSISYETSDLYKQKREVQSSDLPDSEKYAMCREIQAQINALMEEALGSYENPHIEGIYAEVGSKRFNMDEESGNWYEIKPTNADGSDNWYYQMEQEVTQALGIGYGEYWNNREEYNFAYQKPGKYAIAQSVGGYQDYLGYSNAMYDIHADKDENGKSINGTRKTKIVEYINGLDCEYGMKIILYKSEYPSDDSYNYDIIEYLNDRDDISYEQMETILKELGFNVSKDGRITW